MELFSEEAAKPFFDALAKNISVPEQWVNLFREAHSKKTPADLTDFPEIERQEQICEGRTGHAIPLIIFKPRKPINKIFIYIHGGGFISPLGGRHLRWAKYLAAKSNMIMICVEHRLAPEHIFPAALYDCVDVYQYFRQKNDSEIIVGGDSSGGNLALAMGYYCLQEQIVLPKKFVALSAVTDLCFEKHAAMLNRGMDNLDISHMFLAMGAFQRACYAPNSQDWQNPLVSPVYGDLSRLSPTLIVAPEKDYCFDDNMSFYHKMKQAGGDVTLHRYPWMPHSFFTYFDVFPEQAKMANQNIIEFIVK